jgi:ParB-like chromosome segregation protein Spo0J
MAKKKRLGSDPFNETMDGSLNFVKDSRQKDFPNGVNLSEEIYQVELEDLKPNPLNKKFFKEEGQDYFKKLTKDIQERGVIVPLIAKKDGTLLAGHNRYRIAKELGFPRVPVQYIESELSKDREVGFVIKDNLFRRQLSQTERESLYLELFPDLKERLMVETRGGDRKSLQGDRLEIKPKKSKEQGARLIQIDSEGITAREIAEKTKDLGISEHRVKRDLAGLRKKSKVQGAPLKPEKPKTDPIEIVSKHLAAIEKAVLDEPQDKIKEAIEVLESTIDYLKEYIKES